MERKRKLLEKYTHETPGYKPFLIRTGWQVAKLNFSPEQALSAINKIEVHTQTDEVFILLNGTAILILADRQEQAITFQCERMERGITYNIPRNIWHNIAMQDDAEVIIVENNNTHLNDVQSHYLTDKEQRQLQQQIRATLAFSV